MKKLKLIPLVFAALAISISSCKKDDTAPDANSQEKNSFKVRMTDAPGNFASLNAEILSVEAYLQDSGWVSLENQAQFVNVTDLTNGNETTIAYTGSASAGVYTKLRLKFGNQTDLMLNSSNGSGVLQANLTWGSTGEVIIEIDEQVSSTSGADVLLDFQVAQSLIGQGQQYVIDPVITVIEDESTGLQGEVQGAANAMIVLTNGENQFSTFIDAQGNFLIRGVDEGTYDMIVTEMDGGDSIQDKLELNGVIITQGEITQAGTIQF